MEPSGKFSPLDKTIHKLTTYLVIADPSGNVGKRMFAVLGLIITVPSTNGAYPGRNLQYNYVIRF